VRYLALAVLCVAGCSLPREVADTHEGFQHRWGDSPVDPDGSLRWLRDGPNAAGWSPSTATDLPPNRSGNQYLWKRFQLPPVIPTDGALFLESTNLAMDVFVGNERVLRHGDPDRRVFTGFRWHMIPLDQRWAGRTVALRFWSDDPRWIGLYGLVLVGPREPILSAMFQRQLPIVTLAGLFIMVGIGLLLLWATDRSRRPHRDFGAFALIMGVYYFLRSDLEHFVHSSPLAAMDLELSLLYVGPVLCAGFIIDVVGPGPGNVLRWCRRALLTYAVVAILLIWTGAVRGLSTLLPAQALMLVLVASSLWGTIAQARRGNVEARIICVGFVSFALTGIEDILATINLVPWHPASSAFGLLGFMVALGAVLVRRFLEVHRRLERLKANLEHVLGGTKEMAAAREPLVAVRTAVSYVLRDVKLSDGAEVEVVLLPPERVGTYPQRAVLVLGGVEVSTPAFEPISADAAEGWARALGDGRATLQAGGRLVVPIVWGQERIGALVFARYLEPVLDREDRHLVEALASSLGLSLENLFFVDEAQAKARLETELEAARVVQRALLPADTAIPGVEISSSYHAAAQTGGDWFGYHHDPRTQQLYLYVGDVSGHGFGSALLTGVVCGATQAQRLTAERLEPSARPEARLRQLASVLDEVVHKTGREELVMSMVLVGVDLQTGEGLCFNAGHNFPLLLRAAAGEVKVLAVPGSRLGEGAGRPLKPIRFQLAAGDLLFFYTDGLVENPGPDGRALPMKELYEVLRAARDDERPNEAILARARAIWRDAPARDDVTTLIVRYKGPGASAEEIQVAG